MLRLCGRHYCGWSRAAVRSSRCALAVPWSLSHSASKGAFIESSASGMPRATRSIRTATSQNRIKSKVVRSSGSIALSPASAFRLDCGRGVGVSDEHRLSFALLDALLLAVEVGIETVAAINPRAHPSPPPWVADGASATGPDCRAATPLARDSSP